jgi:2-polyprenyl-3-methyl-5-hydroxy-6-metoxy-1,4-benzoquinol methylase
LGRGPSEPSGTELRAARAAAYENPRPEVAALVPAGTMRVLDLGCASGRLGEAISRDGAEVVGIEADPAYARDAEARLDRVVHGDLETIAGRGDLEDDLGHFDCLIAADVLEHLIDPWSCLAAFARLLDPGGAAVVSLPNVRHWETFWQLGARGRWPRRSEGIFDRDHLRWFTARDGLELIAGAGLVPVRVERVYRLRQADPRWPAAARLLERTPLRPFFAFQNLFLARRA